jgi:hypothetical protein
MSVTTRYQPANAPPVIGPEIISGGLFISSNACKEEGEQRRHAWSQLRRVGTRVARHGGDELTAMTKPQLAAGPQK